MQRQQLIEEIKTLMDLVARGTTSLADSVMELDVREYTDPERFQREKIELFRNYPQFVGPSCLLPEAGDYFAFDDTGVPILIVRTPGGGLNAFVNICSHRGAPLNDYFAVEVSVPGPRPDAVEIDADMPEHHHGMLSEPVVTEVAPGRWRAEGMLLHMPGDWEIYVTVLRNGRRERGVFPLHLEPY